MGIIIAVLTIALFILLLLTMGESLVKITAKQSGASTSSFSVFPETMNAIFGRSKGHPNYVAKDLTIHHFDRGFDINLIGDPSLEGGIQDAYALQYALKPKDFIGMSPIPKLMVEIGAHVKAGDPIFYDKVRKDVLYAAPVSGTVVAVNRAEKRSIAEIVINADEGNQIAYREYELPDLEAVSREELVKFLLGSGAWPFLRQRPYDTVANPEDSPKAIFVSTFDSAPLAPDLNLAVKGREMHFQKGLDVLNRLTEGQVHLGLDAGKNKAPAAAFTDADGVQINWFSGKHPAGNVGVHIHHIDPINMGDVVWYLDVHAVLLLGTLFLEGKFDTKRLTVLTGAELEAPRYVWAHQGAKISDIAGGVSKEIEKTRFVSGDLLTGTKVEYTGFLGFFDDQLSTAEEGDYYELLGWLVPQKGHPTMSRTFPGGFFPDSKYEADTNMNGELRAFVMSGQYESVLPMDIYPQHLLRAIQAKDFERMEGLGLLELSEEDVALCEYVCTSKQPIQALVREGLDMMREQG